MKQYHKRFYLYGKTVPELLDKVNGFTKQYSVGNIFDVSLNEVLEKEIEIQTNYDNNSKEIDNSNPSDNKIKTTTIYKYSYYAIVLILIEE
jgi:hypothetical protein